MSLFLKIQIVSVLAAATVMLHANPAAAQLPSRLDPTVRGYQIQQEQMAAVAAAEAYWQCGIPNARATRFQPRGPGVAPGPEGLQVTAATPHSVPVQFSIAIRGPYGEVREFPGEAGREGWWDRGVVVRPRRPVTTWNPTAPGR